MILEVLSYLGTSVGGKLFGMVTDIFAERRAAAREKQEQKFHKRLAEKNALKEYLAAMYQPQPNGKPPLLAYVSAYTLVLFATVYAVCTASCFFIEPLSMVFTKDPSEDAITREIFFGAIKWDVANNRILEMSRIGLGYLMCYPIIFILSMVNTGERLQRRR